MTTSNRRRALSLELRVEATEEMRRVNSYSCCDCDAMRATNFVITAPPFCMSAFVLRMRSNLGNSGKAIGVHLEAKNKQRPGSRPCLCPW